jgi:hypothetical protein
MTTRLSAVRHGGGCHLRGVRLADASCEADSVIHLTENDDNDDVDGIGGSDDGSSGDDE